MCLNSWTSVCVWWRQGICMPQLIFGEQPWLSVLPSHLVLRQHLFAVCHFLCGFAGCMPASKDPYLHLPFCHRNSGTIDVDALCGALWGFWRWRLRFLFFPGWAISLTQIPALTCRVHSFNSRASEPVWHRLAESSNCHCDASVALPCLVCLYFPCSDDSPCKKLDGKPFFLERKDYFEFVSSSRIYNTPSHRNERHQEVCKMRS